MGRNHSNTLLGLILLTTLIACQTPSEIEHPRLEISSNGKITGTSEDLTHGIPIFDSEKDTSAGQLVFDGNSSPPPESNDYFQPAILFPDKFDTSTASGFAVLLCHVKKLDELMWQITCESQMPELSYDFSSNTQQRYYRI